MKKMRLRPWVIVLLFILFLIGIIYYSYEVAIWYLHINENKVLEQTIEKSIIKTNNEENEYEIDFNTLKEINPDTIAFIKVNDTNIQYIVVKGTNNSYYLNHNFEKKWNIGGWIFADYRNKVDETDKNLIIYGHNMKDGSMFDTLINVLKEEWYKNKENHTITLITEKGKYKYQVFSTYSIKPEEYYIKTYFNSTEEYIKFLNTIKERSIYNYATEVTEIDKILTLSSCIGDGKKRVVLHAKLLKEEQTGEES